MKKKFLTIVLSLFILGINNSLSQTKTCDPVQFTEISIKCTQSRTGNYIIRNQQEYLKLTKNWSSHPNCSNYSLPVIDFNNYTLLGIVTSVGGCKPPSNTCFVNKYNNVINFILEINQIGTCMAEIQIIKWITIPHVNNLDSINFNIKISYE
jgi:hypothetical protein